MYVKNWLVDFGFNVPPTAKVIWRWDPGSNHGGFYQKMAHNWFILSWKIFYETIEKSYYKKVIHFSLSRHKVVKVKLTTHHGSR